MPGDVLPGQQELALDWFERLGALSDDLLSLSAIGLGLPPEQFAAAFGNHATSLTKLISYPPTHDGAAGVNAHIDTPLDRGRATNVGWFHGDQGADRTRPRSEAPDIGSTTHAETYRETSSETASLGAVPKSWHGTTADSCQRGLTYTQLFVE
ncbi:MAG: hypothetical protein ACI9CV_001171 [Ilumatobacter sp.]|jgi:hypothetical protein